jgi:hypothetical protein
MRDQFQMALYFVPLLISGKVSMDRLGDFLRNVNTLRHTSPVVSF